MANNFEKGLQFGDGITTTRVTTVSNQYGPRTSEGASGVVKTEGSFNEMKLEITGETASAGALDLVKPIVPAGSDPVRVWVHVEEAFTLGGTTPTILVGTDGSEVTNGFVISEAQAEAVGTYDVTSTLTGTWANALAAATTVDVAMGGTSPTSAATGKLQVVVEYARQP